MAVPKQTHIFCDKHFKEFLTESATCTDVLDSLVKAERQRTEMTLNRPGLTPDYVTQMVAVLVKASRSTNTTGVIDLLSVLVGSYFFMKELVATSSSFVKSTDEEEAFGFIETLVDLLNQVSLRLPSSFTNAFGLIIILQKRTEDMLLTAEGEHRKRVIILSERLAEMRDNVMKRMVSHSRDNPRLPFEKQAPPDDFRNIPILPRVSDIFLGSRGAFLRKNKSHGGYDNLNHYLDVQFRLYREDCISPLREGITQYVQEVSAGHSVRRLQDGRLYKNVSVEYVKHSVEGQIYKATLDGEHAQRIKWKSSRRLLYGSLLCLSADSFHTMVFAVVADSDRDILAKDHSFEIVFPTEVGEMRLPVNATFTMVESTAYFEAYRHVLAGLQRLEDGEMPFEKYIVRCMKDVDLPQYMTDKDVTYDFQPIVSGDVIFRNGFRTHSNQSLRVEVNSPICHWPSAEQLRLDHSQFEAYHAALTQEFVLIQGPPGTGKTHVGLQIAKTLLHNKDAWQERTLRHHKNMQSIRKNQILVVCYTNHALDQFMEGIIMSLDGSSKRMWSDEIVRVGGRSENEAIQEFSLKNRRRHNHHRSIYERHEQEAKLDRLYNLIVNQHHRISFLAYSLNHVNDTVLEVELLKPVMQTDHHAFFVVEDDQLPSEKLLRWLKADEDSWFQRSKRAYTKMLELKTVSISKSTKTVIPTATNVDNIEENEAKKVEDDRRIEDEDFDVQFNGQVGFDIRQQLMVVLDKLQSQQHLDQQFELLLQREANATLARLKASDRMDEKEASDIRCSLRKLAVEKRWRLYRYWVYLYQQMQKEQLPELEKQYYESIRVYNKEKKEVDAEILKTSTLIGMTTTGAAKYQDVLKEIGPRIVIVEEAAEVLEAHIVTALSPRCEHLILIGDHKQLEPKPSVMQLALKYNLSLSMFERMLNNGIKNHCLQRQHRMRPEISVLVRDIYDVLEDNENVFEYEHIMGVKKDVFFINHNKPEDYKDDIRSYSNRHEAQYIACLCKYLMKQGYESTQITVLAAYTGQMFCIRDCMPRQEFEGVKTVAIDNFQGEENDIILLSLVRSNKDGKIGFLSRENRICVALSRAKKGLYVIGNFNLFESRNSQWADIVQKLKTAEQFGKALHLYCQNHPQAEGIQAEDASDFKQSPEGGCELKCDFRLCCGHACRLYCHPIDKTHTKYVCRQPCGKICENEHICNRKCHYGEDCECPVTINKVLLCGHRADMKCCQPAQTFKCQVIVNRELGCGHSVQLKCHIDTEIYKCKIIVTRTLGACSHQADMQCCEDPDKHKCRTMVKRTPNLCEHEAEVECCFDMLSYRCKIKVNRILPSCGHEADMKCYKVAAHVRCDKIITKTRDNCEHSYDVRCSDWNSLYERRNPCSESVTKSWACPHTKVMKCHESKYATCQDKCLKICDQNHTCQKKCHYSSSCKCDVVMKKIIPKCGHKKDISCHRDPESVACDTMVLKHLTTCSHEMMMECSADPSSYRYKASCDILVPKTIPLCHHTQIMKCSESPAMHRCKETVGKTHPRCGHTIQVECYATPFASMKCDTLVSKTLPCGHEKNIECSESLSVMSFRYRQRCEEDVEYVLPKCGHVVTIPCHVKTSLDKQKTTRSKVSERSVLEPSILPMCTTPVTKIFSCGHEIIVECSMSEQQTCSSNCSKLMSCGHACLRKCTQCFGSLTHSECKEPCRKRQICGHDCTSKTCGSCKLCSEKCDKYCPHRQCDHPCFRECIPCMKTCPLQCPHHNCSRLCHEECDRPRCDQPCPQLLECKHPCMGYCGDPCPRLCLTCEPASWSEFDDEWNSFGNIRIVRLEECGHEHSARYLDKLFDKKDNSLGLLCCPKCAKVIKWHSRYTNRLKKQWETLAIMKKALRLGSEDLGDESMFPTICGGVAETQSYLKRFNTHLFFQKELNNHRNPLKGSYSWSKSTTDQLTMFLLNLRKSATITQQDASSINRTLIKLSATWLLYIANSLDKDISSSDSEDEDGVTSPYSEDDLDLHALDFDNVGGHETRYVKKSERREKKMKTNIVENGMNAIVQAADNLIEDSQTFGRTELGKVRQMLGELLTNHSEIDQVMNFPRLQTIGVHTDNWLICSAGHIGSAVLHEETCEQCTSGTSLTLTYKTFLENWRDQFKGELNPDSNARGSKGNRHKSKRGANGRGGRGTESSMHGNRDPVSDDQNSRTLPSGPTYMASPHQPYFEQRGRGWARPGQGRGGFGGQGNGRGDRRGQGVYRGDGPGRGMWRNNTAGSGSNDIWDDRESVSDIGGGRKVGFGRNERGKERRGDGSVNRRVDLRDAEAASVVAAARFREVNTRWSGREGEVRGRGWGDRGRGWGDRGRGLGDRGRGRGDRGRGWGDRGRGRGDSGRGRGDRGRGGKGNTKGRRQ